MFLARKYIHGTFSVVCIQSVHGIVEQLPCYKLTLLLSISWFLQASLRTLKPSHTLTHLTSKVRCASSQPTHTNETHMGVSLEFYIHITAHSVSTISNGRNLPRPNSF